MYEFYIFSAPRRISMHVVMHIALGRNIQTLKNCMMNVTFQNQQRLIIALYLWEFKHAILLIYISKEIINRTCLVKESNINYQDEYIVNLPAKHRKRQKSFSHRYN